MNSLINNSNLQWLFITGKGGVGKTSCACAIAHELSCYYDSVLLISTNSRHNINEMWAQEFTDKPSLIKGYRNLFCMVVNVASKREHYLELIHSTMEMKYSLCIFDSGPTINTLKMLRTPSMYLDYFTPTYIEDLNDKLTDPKHTTFINICQSSFLSVFETGRMINELCLNFIDSHIIIVNHLLNPEKDDKKRVQIQKKYLDMIYDLYSLDYDIIQIPIINYEIQGRKNIKKFSNEFYNKENNTISDKALDKILEESLWELQEEE
jgi:arsenite-transporting ATPase